MLAPPLAHIARSLRQHSREAVPIRGFHKQRRALEQHKTISVRRYIYGEPARIPLHIQGGRVTYRWRPSARAKLHQRFSSSTACVTP